MGHSLHDILQIFGICREKIYMIPHASRCDFIHCMKIRCSSYLLFLNVLVQWWWREVALLHRWIYRLHSHGKYPSQHQCIRQHLTWKRMDVGALHPHFGLLLRPSYLHPWLEHDIRARHGPRIQGVRDRPVVCAHTSCTMVPLYGVKSTTEWR